MADIKLLSVYTNFSSSSTRKSNRNQNMFDLILEEKIKKKKGVFHSPAEHNDESHGVRVSV